MVVHTYSIVKTLSTTCCDEAVLKYVKKRRETITCNPYFFSLLCDHFQQVLQHRKWIFHVFLLISHALSKREKKKLRARILHHDLTKFSLVESVGYTIKFGRKKGPRNKKEKKYWEDALRHHYTRNDHHPQFFDGENMNHYALIESIIDMLACRIKKDLTKKHMLVQDMFNIPHVYLYRYTYVDREQVIQHLMEWEKEILAHDSTTHIAETMLKLVHDENNVETCA